MGPAMNGPIDPHSSVGLGPFPAGDDFSIFLNLLFIFWGMWQQNNWCPAYYRFGEIFKDNVSEYGRKCLLPIR